MHRRRQAIGGFAAALAFAAASVLTASPVGAHNTGHVDSGNNECVEVGSGNHPPEGEAHGNDGQPRGVHHAAHSGNSAIEGGSCD